MGTKFTLGPMHVRYRVYEHGQGACKIVGRHDTREAAIEDCAARNTAEREANGGVQDSGWYYTTDANDAEGGAA